MKETAILSRLKSFLDYGSDCEYMIIRKDDCIELVKILESKQYTQPIKEYYNTYVCMPCNARIGLTNMNGNFVFKANFCPTCGKPVVWND